jgi:hypothetical protein
MWQAWVKQRINTAQMILVGKPDVKKLLWKLVVNRRILNWVLKKQDERVWIEFIRLRKRRRGGAFDYGNKPSGFMQCGDFPIT